MNAIDKKRHAFIAIYIFLCLIVLASIAYASNYPSFDKTFLKICPLSFLVMIIYRIFTIKFGYRKRFNDADIKLALILYSLSTLFAIYCILTHDRFEAMTYIPLILAGQIPMHGMNAIW